ncbi:MAG TPA: phosphoribosyltransferase family protein [Ktedonobacterales bacterium]|nr:phosphoribosyltransferase family protein [Ktedonobacterales bacterium]
MQHSDQQLDNLWLARALWDLGAVKFGDFTVGNSTVHSPVFVNPKLLISNPTALRVAVKLMYQEIALAQSLRHPRAQPYDVVAGVPVGGLLLATAYSLETNTPLVYSRLRPEGTGARGVEGRYTPGSRVLLIDDLVTGGGGLSEIAQFLGEHDLAVRDAVVLIDRGHSAAEALRQQGINFISILNLDVMMMHYLSSGLIADEQHQAYQRYVRETAAARSTRQNAPLNPTDEPGAGGANGHG